MVNVIHYGAKQIRFWLFISICTKCKSRWIFCWNHFGDLFKKCYQLYRWRVWECSPHLFDTSITLFYFSRYINTYEYENIIYHALSALNLSPPCAAYMRLWTESALFQIMACRMDSAKPLSEPILTYYQLDPEEHISIKFDLKFKYLHSRKCVSTCHLQNGGHFVQGEMS